MSDRDDMCTLGEVEAAFTTFARASIPDMTDDDLAHYWHAFFVNLLPLMVNRKMAGREPEGVECAFHDVDGPVGCPMNHSKSCPAKPCRIVEGQ